MNNRHAKTKRRTSTVFLPLLVLLFLPFSCKLDIVFPELTTVSLARDEIPKGGMTQFTAVIKDTVKPAKVKWTIASQNVHRNTTINQDGQLRVSREQEGDTLIIHAVSLTHEDTFSEARVKLRHPIPEGMILGMEIRGDAPVDIIDGTPVTTISRGKVYNFGTYVEWDTAELPIPPETRMDDAVWYLDGGNGSSIDLFTGTLTVSQYETAENLIVKAISRNDYTVVAEKELVIGEGEATHVVLQYSNDVGFRDGEALVFTASVKGTGAFNKDIVWNIQGAKPVTDLTFIESSGMKSNGTVEGILLIPGDELNDKLIISAHSRQNPALVQSVEISVAGNKLPDLPLYGWRLARLGVDHTLALTRDGALWSWGRNHYGQLGLGDTTSRTSPTRVGDDNDWVMVSAGLTHSMALKANGELYMWGIITADGQPSGDPDIIQAYGPIPVKIPGKWVYIAAGYSAAYAIKDEGRLGRTLWSWGFNQNGRLGHGSFFDKEEPTQVGTDSGWISVAGGMSHALGIRNDGRIYAWGSNDDNRLGIIGGGEYLAPIEVVIGASEGSGWRTVVAGSNFSAALDDRGRLWTWGSTQSSRTAGNTSTAPAHVQQNTRFQTISAHFGSHGIAIARGIMYTWGNNSNGQLGNNSSVGDSEGRLITPYRPGDYNIPGAPPHGKDIAWVFASTQNSMAVSREGRLWVWGSNIYGQLGTGESGAGKNKLQPFYFEFRH